MGKRTPLYDAHLALGAKIVDFGGWDMPLHYGSQLDEHRQVRTDAGMFDVSHMTVCDVRGENARAFLRRLIANDVAKLKVPGRALYGCMLNERGGIIDDLIVYYLDDRWYRVVTNAATHDKDLAWMRRIAAATGAVELTERDDLAMIAVQGPQARARAYAALGEDLARAARGLEAFHSALVGELFVATTGYTGEDGLELILPAARAPGVWAALHAAGVAPIGLGARDTLRLEAGMALYGADMDETTTPLESGLAWTVAWEPKERDFIGRAVLERQRAAGVPRAMVGLVLEDKGVLRSHMRLACANGATGEITSGSFSPTLNRSIALARVGAGVAPGDRCQVEIRGKMLEARVVKYPFARNGKACI